MTREESIRTYCRNNGFPLGSCSGIASIQADTAVEAIKWADHTMIKRACHWLRKHSSAGDEVATIQFNSIEEMIESLKNYMEQ